MASTDTGYKQSNLLGCQDCLKTPDEYPTTTKPLPHDALPISATHYTISRGQYDVDKYMKTRERLLAEATVHLAGERFTWVIEYMGTGAIVRPAAFAGKRLNWLQKGMAVQGNVVVLEDEGNSVRRAMKEIEEYDRSARRSCQ